MNLHSAVPLTCPPILPPIGGASLRRICRDSSLKVTRASGRPRGFPRVKGFPDARGISAERCARICPNTPSASVKLGRLVIDCALSMRSSLQACQNTWEKLGCNPGGLSASSQPAVRALQQGPFFSLPALHDAFFRGKAGPPRANHRPHMSLKLTCRAQSKATNTTIRSTDATPKQSHRTQTAEPARKTTRRSLAGSTHCLRENNYIVKRSNYAGFKLQGIPSA